MSGEDSIGHRQRLRSKFESAGQAAFLDYELLELILTFAIPRRDVKPIAKQLMDEFHSFPAVLDAKPDELAAVSGLGPNSVTLIKLIRSACLRYLTHKMEDEPLLNSSAAIADFARMKLGDHTDEIMLVFYLNTQKRLIRYDILGSGTIDSVSVHPPVVAKNALRCSAKDVVICHNHPSGNVEPSKEDDTTTLSIRRTLTPFEISLLDHIIVSRSGYYSYREHAAGSSRRANLLSPLPGDES